MFPTLGRSRHCLLPPPSTTLLLALVIVLAIPAEPAFAQGPGGTRGFPGLPIPVPRVRELETIPGKVVRGVDRGVVRQLETFRRTLGAVAVATVGVGILARLGAAERTEVARRATTVVRADPDREVVETYETGKGKRTVTIKASPAQPKASFADDPALQPETQASGAADAKGARPAKAEAAKREDGIVAFDDVPETTRCRKVETQIAEASTTRTDASPTVTINAAVVCQLGENEWKPVGKR